MNNDKLKPLPVQTLAPAKNCVFAQVPSIELTTKSGLILAATSVERPKTAEIINVGSDVDQYKRGDTIFYKLYSATEIKLNGDDFLIIQEDDILGKVIDVIAND